MASDEGEHDNEDEVEEHGNGEAPGHDEDPGAVAEGFVGGGVDIGGSFGGDDADGDAQAEGGADRRTVHFEEERLMTAFAECPGLAGFGDSDGFHEVGVVKPGAAGADGAANAGAFCGVARLFTAGGEG